MSATLYVTGDVWHMLDMDKNILTIGQSDWEPTLCGVYILLRDRTDTSLPICEDCATISQERYHLSPRYTRAKPSGAKVITLHDEPTDTHRRARLGIPHQHWARGRDGTVYKFRREREPEPEVIVKETVMHTKEES